MAVNATQGADAPRSARSRPWFFWSRLHFLVRLLGLTGGLLACATGVIAAVRSDDAGSASEFRALRTATDLPQAWEAGRSLAQAAWESPERNWAVTICLAGAAAALFALLIELLVVFAFTATRRSAFGFNAVLQSALAAVAVVAINLWSFHHFKQVDFTRDRQFTLPAEVRKDLAQLHPGSQTTIIVYNRHKVFGLMPDKPQDDFDSAAERKVIEKVHDLIEQFRSIGPQIRVEVLDTQSRDYKFRERLGEVTKEVAGDKDPRGAESMRKMIEAAPENSLFFCGRENDKLRVQQLSFNDFYLLDKTLSQEDHGGRGNLVLLYQGVEPFAHRILRLGEKKPRIAIATIHEVLTTGSQREIGLYGLRTALEARGFDVTDIVLKKESNTPPLGLDPAVYSLEESKLEGLKRTQRFYENDLEKFQKIKNETQQQRAFWEKAADDPKTRDSLMKQIAQQAPQQAREYDQKVQLVDATIQRYQQALRNPPSEAAKTLLQRELSQLQEARPQVAELRDLWKNAVTESAARDQLLRRVIQQNLEDFDEDLQSLAQALADYRQRLGATQADIAKMNEPALEEQRRMTDLKAKLQRLLADCDLLMVPRMTLRNTANSFNNIAPQFYALDAAQVEAIKEFLKAGKPILACFGPLNSPPGNFDEARPDALEELFDQLGVKMLKQTVLFDSEEQGFAENRAGLTIAGTSVEIPPLIWDWRSRDSLPPGSVAIDRPSNRIRAGIRLTARGLGKEEALDIRLRHPRPIYYVPPEPPSLRPLAGAAWASPAQPSWTGLTLSLAALRQSLNTAAEQLPVDPVFLMTSPQSWNEDQPFPTEGRIPSFEQPQRDQDKRKQLRPAITGLETRRRGPFPIGVAVEATLPREWYASQSDKPARARLAVIGQGGFFAGKELPAAQEKLLVQTINWLLGRDDRLPRDERVWSYPRVNDTIPPDSSTDYLWLWGARLGLPVLFLYLGFVVVLFRRLR
jgi:tetratricopeptide (TPR) repeat protein